ncbi:MAG: class I SAM-dependent methyltransferase [Paracoccaceae bacterium]
MTEPPLLTDRAALSLHRRRAVLQGFEPFLYEDIAAEVDERLAEVNRPFTYAAFVSGFPFWCARRFPQARAVEDGDTLDLAPAAHDLVVHFLCLHWANDPVGQLIQCRRALMPDGWLLCVLFGGRTLAEFRSALAEAETRLSGGLSPRVLPMGEIRDLGGLLQRAGFALPVADVSSRTVSYPSVMALVSDLRGMGEGNAMAARTRSMPRSMLPLAADIYEQSFGAGQGRIPASFDTVFLTGWAPAPGQPKPLRPGSASLRLADALDVARRGGRT